MCCDIFLEAANVSDKAVSIVRCLAKDELEKSGHVVTETLSRHSSRRTKENHGNFVWVNGVTANVRTRDVPNTVVEFQPSTNMFAVIVFSSVAEKQVCYLHSFNAMIVQISLNGVNLLAPELFF